MKKIFFVFVPLIFTWMLLPCLNAETIRIASIDYCPYQCIPESEDGRHGYIGEIAQTVFSRAGYKLHISYMPFKRAILDTESGESDVILSVNPEHSGKLILSKEKSGVLRQFFYVRKGNPWMYQGPGSLENIKVGSVVGYNYSSFNEAYQAYLDTHRGSVKVQFSGGQDAPLVNFRKILSGRITTFNEDAALFGYITMKAGIRDLFDVAGSLGDNDQYMGFSPLHPNPDKLAAVFDEGIKELRASGALNRILTKYGVQDWE